MNENETLDFWKWVIFYISDPNQREGQAHMNALSRVSPELYEEITGSVADCFYRDDRIPAFLEYLDLA